MKTQPWSNSTNIHPDGVSEAATLLWLKRIKQRGVAAANRIKAQDCDVMQAEVASGWLTWTVDLAITVGAVAFNPIIGHTLKVEDTRNETIQAAIFDHLNAAGEFRHVLLKLGDHGLVLQRQALRMVA